MSNLGINTEEHDEQGIIDVFRPTGHIYGTLKDIAALSRNFSKVVLAVDGGKQYRRDIYDGYKQGRKPLDYPIFDDQQDILKMASVMPNVEIAFLKGYEADDLMATMMDSQESVVLWTRDRDIMQTPGKWEVMDDIVNGKPTWLDVPMYIEKGTATDTKTGLQGFRHLPLLYKVIRGDSSDNIPPGIPRLRHEKLMALLLTLPHSKSLDDLYNYIEKTGVITSEKLEEFRPGIERNFRLVLPRYVPDGVQFVYRLDVDRTWAYNKMKSLELNSLIPVYFPV